jgi:diguanylate cyclase (GGDEF)-like protein
VSKLDIPFIANERCAFVRLLWPYVALWAVVATALAAYTWHEIDASRQREVRDGQMEAENLARVLAAQTTRSAESFERTLGIIKAIHENSPRGAQLAVVGESLKATGTSELERRVLRYDRNGVLSDATDPQALQLRITATALPWFAAARDGRDGGVIIGTPTIGRLSGRPTIPFAMRLNDAAGGFDGVLVATLDPMRLVQLLREIRVGERSSIGIMNKSGLIYAWSAWSNASATQAVAERPVTLDQVTDPRGIVVQVPVPGTDLVAFAALSEERLLESHRRYARHLAGFALLTLVALTLPIGLVAQRAVREASRRLELEHGFELERAYARTDALTGVANRRGYEDTIESCLADLARARQPFVLAVIDVDRFKQLNDSRGHAAGDRALQKIAQTLTACVRRSDLVARLGGDEFTVVMPATDAHAMGRPFSAMFSALTVMAAAEGWPIGFSLGVIAFETPPDRRTTASELADKLMYDVKGAGRSGVRFAAYRDGSLHEVAPAPDDEDLRVP